jgi:hypothetical protein
MHILGTLGAVALGSLSLGGCHDNVGRLAATDAVRAVLVPQAPLHQQGSATVGPVYFTDQTGIDALCGGNNQIVACAIIGGGWMALPNPCQARFAGESYAAVACHEKGHSLGWRHG